MKIAQIVEATQTGVGRHVLDLTAGLAACGDRLHLIYSPLRMDAYFRAKVEAFRKIPNVVLSELEMPHAVSPLREIKTVRKIARYLREHGPFDIVHGHSSKGGAYARLAAALVRRASKVIYTPNAFVTLSSTISPLKMIMFEALEKFLARRFTDQLIMVSRDEHAYALQLGIPERKLAVIANGVQIEPGTDGGDNIRSMLGLDSSDVIIGFVGRLDAQKSPIILLRAFSQCAKNGSAKLVVIGEGPQRQQLEAFVTQEKVDGVSFMGYQERASHLMADFDIFALPSDYEGLPYTLIEAMANQLPVVATDCSGNRELVRNGENGFLVPRGDSDSMAKKLAKLVGDRDLRRKMGADSYVKYLKNYTKSTMIKSTRELYVRMNDV